MLRAFAILLIGLGFGGAMGFVAGQSQTRHAAAPPAMEHAGHAHVHGEPLDMPPGENAPTVALAVTADPGTGWNINIQTTGFRFAAENASGSHIEGEGHAHLYVNGEKVARVYGEWFHIEELPSGPVEVEAVLNSNDHRALTVGGVPVSATVSFDNPG